MGGQVGSSSLMLAHFSLLGASGAPVLAFVTFRCHTRPVLARLGALRARFWRVPGGSGEGFKAPGPYFPAFLHACALAWSKCSECDKTTVLVGREPQQYAGVPYPKRVLDDGY